MSKSVTRSRLYYRQNARRRRRRRARKKLLFRGACLILLILIGVIGIRSGLEVSKNIKYPVEYSDYIVKYSAENQLDPYLVIGVIKQESNFVPDAKSAYAGGLMQLTEVTAAETARKMGVTNYDYMDPETNIKLGCYLLRTLIDKYQVIDTVLAAYNAGTGNVDKWLADPTYSDDGITLKEIPYSETRHYVQKVNNHIKHYKEKVQLSQ